MPRAIHWHNLDGSPIIVTENVFEYRRCISEHVRSDDVVAEVGCAEGLTTALLAQQAHRAFGIDKSPSQVAKAATRHQHQHNLSFHLIDAWDLNSVLRVTAAAGVTFSVVFVDVSGSRNVGDVENLMMKYEQVFNPRLFVVKSYHLKRLVNRCQMFFCPSNHNKQPHTAAATALEADADSDVMAHWQQPQEQLQQQPHPGAADETDADNDFTTDWQQQQQEDKEQQQQQHTDARSFGNVLAADAAAGAPCQQQQQLADAQLWEEIC